MAGPLLAQLSICVALATRLVKKIGCEIDLARAEPVLRGVDRPDLDGCCCQFAAVMGSALSGVAVSGREKRFGTSRASG